MTTCSSTFPATLMPCLYGDFCVHPAIREHSSNATLVEIEGPQSSYPSSGCARCHFQIIQSLSPIDTGTQTVTKKQVPNSLGHTEDTEHVHTVFCAACRLKVWQGARVSSTESYEPDLQTSKRATSGHLGVAVAARLRVRGNRILALHS